LKDFVSSELVNVHQQLIEKRITSGQGRDGEKIDWWQKEPKFNLRLAVHAAF